MHKPCPVGIHVSAHTLEVVLARPEPSRTSATFDNTPSVKSLEVALALDLHSPTEVMVVIPRAIKNYAGARLQRAKTDPVDAQLILDFVQAMDFVP